MKTYYHVSRDYKTVIEKFVPCVPSSFLVSGGEDRSVKRVCVSEDFLNCMNAINYYADKDVYDEYTGKYKPLRVYQFELDENEVIPPEEVYKHSVHDALINKECWILKEVVPVTSFIIQPTYLTTGKLSPIHITYMDFDRVDEDLNVIG